MDVQAFLKDIQWFQSIERLPEMEQDFIRHMERGLAGESSSLPMIPTYLSAGDIPQGEHKVIVLDAGGTNLRTFLVKISAGQLPEVLYAHKCPMPGREAPVEKTAFFDAIAAQVLPVAEQADRIGFCFSFPCVIHPNYDGEILYMDKEIVVQDIEGAFVGAELNAALKRFGCTNEHRVIVLNDTVAALLGTLASHTASNYSGYIGMILGTGMNCCYQEQNVRILKNPLLREKAGASIINMEAGSYIGNVPLSRADLVLKEYTKEAGTNLTEKMMSGAYQGALMQALLGCAINAGLFSAEFSRRFEELPRAIETKDVSLYTYTPAEKGVLADLCGDTNDQQLLWTLADAVLERAAMYTTMMLTAIMRHTDAGRNPVYPVSITIEGTTFEQEYWLRNKIKSYMISYAQKQQGFYSRIFQTPDANMVGAATAAILAQ